MCGNSAFRATPEGRVPLQYLSETHLLNETDDADGLFLAKGQGARQAVELP